ncbi:polyubiquitin-like [Oratosquilla oratoria]|uniref:polyubiquitin-like n=1 Tax=Oratosquilla oratoria TaxID=337810 RepID=UPI003F7628AE
MNALLEASVVSRNFAIGNLYPTTTVAELKAVISDKRGIPVDQQRNIFNGKRLKNRSTLKDCAVSAGSQIHLILRLGGAWWLCPGPSLLDPQIHYDLLTPGTPGLSFQVEMKDTNASMDGSDMCSWQNTEVRDIPVSNQLEPSLQ